MNKDHKDAEEKSTHGLGYEAGYAVGYGKPPHHTRFQKGKSGNPAGRRKGRSNLGTLLNNVLHASVEVNERGKRVIKSKLEIALTQAVNKAAAGDLKAIAMITRLAQFSDEVTQSEVNSRLNADQQTTKEMARALGARMVKDLAQSHSHDQSQTGESS